MWGSTAEIHSINTFKEAEEMFDRLLPIRGHDKLRDGVPMRSDRKDWQTKFLRRIDSDTYAIVHHYTDIVTFSRDGTVRIDLGYNSVTTRDYFDQLCFWGVRVQVRNFEQVFSFGAGSLCDTQVGRVVQENGGIVTDNIEFLMNESIVEMHQENSGWHIDTDFIDEVYTRRIDAKKAKVIRATFSKLMDTASFFKNSPMSLAVAREMSSDTYFHAYKFVGNWDEDDDNAEVIAQTIASFHDVADWNHKTLARGTEYFNFDKMKRDIYTAAYEEAEAYIYKELPFGKLPASLKNIRRK